MVGRNHGLVGTLVLAGALSGCSSGGGGGGAAASLTVDFVEPSSAVDEGQLARIELTLSGHGALPAPLEVRLVRVQGGDAIAGEDYSLDDAVATFPAGSRAGDTATAEVPVLADGLIEATDERMLLRLEGGGPGASVDDFARHELTLVEPLRARLQFAAASSSTSDQTSNSFGVSVRLALPEGAQLAGQVSATVLDTLGGDAESGVDYQAFPATTVAFGPADADGSELTITVQVQGDSVVEENETVRLALDAPSARAELGPVDEHQLVIIDGGPGGDAELTITADDGLGQTELSGGETLDLGSQPSGAGPNAGVLLELSNLSPAELALSVATLTGDTRDFAVELEPDGAGALPVVLEFPLRSAGEDALQGVLLELDAARLAALEDHATVVLRGVPTPGGRTLSLELERLPAAWSPTAVVVVDGRAVEPEALVGDQSLWRGSIVGERGSSAFLAFSRHGSHGWIRRASSELLHLVSERAPVQDAAAPAARLIADHLLEAQIVRPIALECGGAVQPGEPGGPQELGGGPTVGPCRLAVESDYQLYQRFGDAAAETAYVAALFAAVSAQYRFDAQTELTLDYLGIYTTSNDPWTSQDGGGGTIDLLYEFQNAWNASGWPVDADLAHFVSGANLGGGVAYLDVLCDGSYGYGVSANIDGDIDWENFDGQPSSLSWDFVVVAHELGHNFGSSHTHDYCPPLDVCSSNCDGANQCSQGTLMSYCHLCGGMANIRLEFHPHAANRIRQSIDGSCFGGTQLASGASARLRVRFEPGVGTGARQATLSFTHDADNLPSPFTVELQGTATD